MRFFPTLAALLALGLSFFLPGRLPAQEGGGTQKNEKQEPGRQNSGGKPAKGSEAGDTEAKDTDAIYNLRPITLQDWEKQKRFSLEWDFSVPVDLFFLQNKKYRAKIKAKPEAIAETQDKTQDGGETQGKDKTQDKDKTHAENISIEFLENREGGSIYRIFIDGVYYFASAADIAGTIIESYFDEAGNALFLYKISFNGGKCTSIEKRLPESSTLAIFNYDNMDNITEIKKTDENGNVTEDYKGIYGEFGIKYRERFIAAKDSTKDSTTEDGTTNESMEIQYDESGLITAGHISGTEDIYVNYTYKFDVHGNWTECTAIYRKEIMGVLLPVEMYTTKREIIYE